jgi:hypothetical protein
MANLHVDDGEAKRRPSLLTAFLKIISLVHHMVLAFQAHTSISSVVAPWCCRSGFMGITVDADNVAETRPSLGQALPESSWASMAAKAAPPAFDDSTSVLCRIK